MTIPNNRQLNNQTKKETNEGAFARERESERQKKKIDNE